MLERLNSVQITEWQAFFRLEPFGHNMDYYMLGQIASLLYNAYRGKGKSARKPMDFVPFYKGPGEKQDAEEIKSVLLEHAVPKSSAKKRINVRKKSMERRRRRMQDTETFKKQGD